MRPFFSMLKIRFINSMQYRAAAWAGVMTQFFWGFMELLLYLTLSRENPAAFTMTLPQLTSYLWLRQAFFAMFLLWSVDNDILDMIMNGDVAYEVIRPVSLYSLWFARNLGSRTSKVALRCVPILLVSLLLPKPYGLSLPPDLYSAVGFFISMILGVVLLIGMCMWIYIMTFYFITARGIQNIVGTFADFLSGSLIPIPFMPIGVQRVLNILPFASTQSTPYLIYSGYLSGTTVLQAIGLQLLWIVLIVGSGILAMRKALLRVTVQGG